MQAVADLRKTDLSALENAAVMSVLTYALADGMLKRDAQLGTIFGGNLCVVPE